MSASLVRTLQRCPEVAEVWATDDGLAVRFTLTATSAQQVAIAQRLVAALGRPRRAQPWRDSPQWHQPNALQSRRSHVPPPTRGRAARTSYATPAEEVGATMHDLIPTPRVGSLEASARSARGWSFFCTVI